MGEKTSNKKLIWYILFVVFTILLCYLSIVIYFYYGSPYNISLKMNLWPFNSTTSAGQLYQDAIVQIEFYDDDELTFDQVKKSVVGVNVHKNGYIIAPLYLIESNVQEPDYKILTKNGMIYKGNLLYSEKNYNLAIFKCENLTDQAKQIKIPYVKLGSASSMLWNNIIATSSFKGESYSGSVVEKDLDARLEVEFDSKFGVKNVFQNCFSIKLKQEGFSNGVIFNKHGALLGFAVIGTDENENLLVMPVEGANLFLNNVINAYNNQTTYSNEYAQSFIGFDKTEIKFHFLASNRNENEDNKQYFYFENSWQTYTTSIQAYHQQMEITGFYLFEDFVLNEIEVLPKDSIILSVNLNNTNYFINNKLDLIDLCYKFKQGDTVKFIFYQDSNYYQAIVNLGE